MLILKFLIKSKNNLVCSKSNVYMNKLISWLKNVTSSFKNRVISSHTKKVSKVSTLKILNIKVDIILNWNYKIFSFMTNPSSLLINLINVPLIIKQWLPILLVLISFYIICISTNHIKSPKISYLSSMISLLVICLISSPVVYKNLLKAPLTNFL